MASAASAFDWLQKVIAYSVPAASLVFVLFKWAGNTWVGRLLNRDLEQFKEEQQEKLETFKADQQKELERLRHRLSSRISRIHEKEFEVLPQAWLMLNELQGAIAHALDLTIKYYPAFESFSDAELEAFLRDAVAAQRLNEQEATQIKALDGAERQRKFYMDVVMAGNLDDAEDKRRLFNNFLLQHRIFMDEELRTTFANVQHALSSALIDYSVGKNAEDWKMVRSGQQAMLNKRMQELVHEVDRAIQKRLRYAEAG